MKFATLVLALAAFSPTLAWADDVGYIDCHDRPESTQVLGKAAKTSEVVASMPCGERFAVLVYGMVFSRIQTKDGKVGYIHSYLISRDYSATSVRQTTPSQTPAPRPNTPVPNTPVTQPAPAPLTQPVQPQPMQPTATASTTPAQTQDPTGKPRVYVANSQSWAMSGGFSASDGTGAGSFSGGSDPQTVEVIKNFMEKCPTVVVTQNKASADYAVLFDRAGGKKSTYATLGVLSLVHKVNKIAVFAKNGDALFSESVRSVGSAVKDACAAIGKDMSGSKAGQE